MSLNHRPHVGIMIGSLRRESFSRKLAHELVARAPMLDCKIIEIADLPLYNEDLDADPPPAWGRFRSEVAEMDALLFVTPEYNRSVPGGLKNAMDVGSRPEGANVFAGLPAAIVSVTPYSLGAFGANHALRQSFVYLNLQVMQQPEAYVGKAAELLGKDAKVTDPASDEFLRKFMTAFARWIERVGKAGPPFDAFLREREAVSNAYINGSPEPLLELAVAENPASFFSPRGEIVQGATAVRSAHEVGARAFAPGGNGRFEVLQSGCSGSLGFWTGLQHATVRLNGQPGPVTMALRTTEVFRLEGGKWKLCHRHADMAANASGEHGT
jgi:NAD(P)H-dependent FMN reductase/ketosteroid isomerase-like protein